MQEIQERPCGATDKAAGPSFAYWHVADVPGRGGGGGPPPPPLQSTNPFVSFVSFVIEKHSGSPACGSTSPVSVPLCLLCERCVLRNLRFLLPPQRTVRLGGKRVRRTGVVNSKRTRNWVASLGTVMV